MKLKGIELEGTYKIIYYSTCFKVYNKKGKLRYYKDNKGYWAKWEYDKKGNMIYHESRNGKIIDKREKELTIEEIEKLLGYKIKIKGRNK